MFVTARRIVGFRGLLRRAIDMVLCSRFTLGNKFGIAIYCMVGLASQF